MKRQIALMWCMLTFAAVAFAQPPVKLTLEHFNKRAAERMPTKEQLRYQEIPWVHDLAEAQQVAQAENRPIFLWGYGGRSPARQRPRRLLNVRQRAPCGHAERRAGRSSASPATSSRRISTTTIRPAIKDSPSAKLWRSITAQKELQGQGIWIVGPDGKVIGGMSAEVDGHPSERLGNGPGAPWQANPRFADAVVELLDRIAAEVRAGDASATPSRSRCRFAAPASNPTAACGSWRTTGPTAGWHSASRLTKDEWQAFAPLKIAVGTKWTLPDAVARQFASVLSPYADTRFRPRTGDLSIATLEAVVHSADERHARIRYKGHWKADWKHDDREHSIAAASAEGFAIYNLEAKAMRAFVLLFDGTYSYTSNPAQRHEPKPVAAVVRWRLKGNPE